MALNRIQVKRGKSSSWLSLNPTLRPGEPGFETDTGKLKIGDGNKAWIELGYVGEGKGFIVNVPTHYDFPALGDVNVLYKASQEKQICRILLTQVFICDKIKM